MNKQSIIHECRRLMPSEAEKRWLEYIVSDPVVFHEAVSDYDFDLETIQPAIEYKDHAMLGVELHTALRAYAETLCEVHSPFVYSDFEEMDDSINRDNARAINRDNRLAEERGKV